MVRLALTGLVAGVLMGWVLLRGRVCFFSMFRDAWAGRLDVLRAWALAVGIGAVGLSLLYTLSWSDGLNRGLAFRPVGNVAGGLAIGVGMVVARSCASGLFYRLGSGRPAILVGLLGWGCGELVLSRFDLRGPTVLHGGLDGTVPGVLGVPRLVMAVVVLVAVLVLFRPTGPAPGIVLGVALGMTLVAGWVLARLGGASYGPSTVGAVAGTADGSPPWWLIGFLAGLVVGAAAATVTGTGWQLRRESWPRLAGLGVGGFLLGGGGWVAGGCNLGHGLSGLAQLDVASVVAVAAMALGVGLAGRVAALRS